MNAEQEMTWATPEEAAEVQWIITRPAYLILLFVAGWAIDVKVFTRFRIDYASALGLDPDELISAPLVLHGTDCWLRLDSYE